MYFQFITKKAWISLDQLVHQGCGFKTVGGCYTQTCAQMLTEKQHYATFACWNIYSCGQASGREGGGNCGIGGEGRRAEARGGRDAAQIPPLPRNSDRKNSIRVRTRVCVWREELHADASVCDTKRAREGRFSWWRSGIENRWWCVYTSVCMCLCSK